MGNTPSASGHPSRLFRTMSSAIGLLGLGATVHIFDVSAHAILYLSAAATGCAMTAGAVAIVTRLANRSPETRRMIGLQRLARKAKTPSERLAAMTILAFSSIDDYAEQPGATNLIKTALSVQSASVRDLDKPRNIGEQGSTREK
jgi:hypothetical protein